MTTQEVLTKGDALVERGARFLEQVARDFSHDGGPKGKLAEELADDAEFLRRLKPSLIAARIRGEAPTAERPGATRAEVAPVAAVVPDAGAAPTTSTRPRRAPTKDGPNPFLALGIALAAGIAVAKIIDWRGHAHPRG